MFFVCHILPPVFSETKTTTPTSRSAIAAPPAPPNSMLKKNEKELMSSKTCFFNPKLVLHDHIYLSGAYFFQTGVKRK